MNYKGNIKEIFAQEPPKEWLKEINYLDGKKGMYIPIDKIEELLDLIADSWHTEVKHTTLINHSVTVIVRVTMVIGDKVYYQEGGATEVATNTNPIQTIFPKAISMAVKNACKRWGRIFGRDVERQVDAVIVDVPKSDLEMIIELFKEVIGRMPKEEAEAVGRIITNEEVKSYGKVLKVLNKYVGVPENEKSLKVLQVNKI